MVHRKLQQIKDRGDNPFIWVLADTESVTLHSDWQQWGGGDFESLLTHISYEASQGTEFLDFPLADNLLFFPMHILEVYWAFVYADTRTRTLYYMDSMFNPVNVANALKVVQTYLFLETVRLRGEEDARIARPFTLRFVPDAPQQTNGYDCSVFVCQYAESISRRMHPSFTQNDMPSLRRNMVWEVMKGRLLNYRLARPRESRHISIRDLLKRRLDQ